jgi:hypothetical protein
MSPLIFPDDRESAIKLYTEAIATFTEQAKVATPEKAHMLTMFAKMYE